MQRRTAVIIGALVVFSAGFYSIATQKSETVGNSGTSSEDNAQLTGAEIEALLAGNTVVGTWGGSSYKQYYGADGFTMYVPEGGQPDEGKWRANHDTNQYESWWSSTGWTPYSLVQTDTGHAWVNGEKLEPFEVLEGKQVSW